MEEKNKILFTSESVSEGHPDKVADKICDAILDDYLAHDECARVACECFITGNYLLISGEITSVYEANYDKIARNVLREIGYTSDELGTNADTIEIDVRMKTQSPDIAQGVDYKRSILDIGAGDQGIMFGYASNESKEYMPLAISIAHELVKRATALRKSGEFKDARPDMKSQVTIDYSTPGKPRIELILMSIQHSPTVNFTEFKKYIHKNIMQKVAEEFNLNKDFAVLINPTGRFEIGGPAGDTGLSGRKIIVDTYGGTARHGGGSFSGKDPSKVDRSATYYARYIAKNLVAAGIADRCEIQLSYAIGLSHAISVGLSTFGTSHYSDEIILDVINTIFDMRPGAIIRQFSLNKPSFRYQDITDYGHFGRSDINLPWEKLDKVEEIKRFVKKVKKN